MNKWVPGFVGIIAAIVSYQMTAHAGSKSNVVVTITTGASAFSARGALGSVRNSANTVERIGCTIHASNVDATFMICEARNAAGTIRSCFTDDVDMIKAGSDLNGDSLVAFDGTLASPSICTSLSVEHGSNLAPKVN